MKNSVIQRRTVFLSWWRKILVCALLFLSLCMSGCSTNEIKVEPAPLPDIENKIAIDVAWKRGIGKGSDERYVLLEPAFNDSAVYMPNIEGVIVALDIENGERQWKIKTDEQISGGLTYDQGRIWYGTFNGDLVCISAETGEELWRRGLSSELLSPVTIDGSLVVAQTADGKIVGLSEADGRQFWVYESPVPSLSLRGTSRPQAVEGAIIAAFASGKLVALNRETGLPIWDRQIAIPEGRVELEKIIDIDGGFIISEGVIYVSTFQGRVAALDLFTGRMNWQLEMSNHQSLAIDASALYLSDSDGYVWALDRETGATVWRQEQLLARSLSAPQYYQNHIVVGDFDGYLHWLDADSGQYVGRVRVDRKGLRGQPLEQQGGLFVIGIGGQLARIELGNR